MILLSLVLHCQSLMCNLGFQGLVPSHVEAVPKILLHIALVIFRLKVRQEEGGSCNVHPNFGVTSTYHMVKPKNPTLCNTAVMLQFIAAVGDAVATIIINEYVK
jgi:hypothetical protein